MNKDITIKILLFKVGAIGDVLMTTPFLRQLKKNYPHAKIDYLVGYSAAEAVEGNPHIDEVIRFDESIFFKKKVFAFQKLVSMVKKRRYDVIFILDKHWIFNITGWLFGIPIRIGFDRMGKEGRFLTRKVFFDGKRHEIKYYLDLLRVYGKIADFQDVTPEIAFGKRDEEYAKYLWSKYELKQKRVIVIAPGGANNPGQSAALKVWPREKFYALIKILLKDYAVILVGDKHDAVIGRFLRVNLNHHPFLIDQTGKTSIKQTAAICQKADYCISSDTGPMHIASAVNPRVISLFGPTDPYRFAPLAKTSVFCWKRMSCCPCNDIYGNFHKCKQNKCMQQLLVEDVLKCIK